MRERETERERDWLSLCVYAHFCACAYVCRCVRDIHYTDRHRRILLVWFWLSGHQSLYVHLVLRSLRHFFCAMYIYISKEKNRINENVQMWAYSLPCRQDSKNKVFIAFRCLELLGGGGNSYISVSTVSTLACVTFLWKMELLYTWFSCGLLSHTLCVITICCVWESWGEEKKGKKGVHHWWPEVHSTFSFLCYC